MVLGAYWVDLLEPVHLGQASRCSDSLCALADGAVKISEHSLRPGSLNRMLLRVWLIFSGLDVGVGKDGNSEITGLLDACSA